MSGSVPSCTLIVPVPSRDKRDETFQSRLSETCFNPLQSRILFVEGRVSVMAPCTASRLGMASTALRLRLALAASRLWLDSTRGETRRSSASRAAWASSGRSRLRPYIISMRDRSHFIIRTRELLKAREISSLQYLYSEQNCASCTRFTASSLTRCWWRMASSPCSCPCLRGSLAGGSAGGTGTGATASLA